MRKPEPWYWTARGGWYVQINKKQHRLGEDLDPRPRAKPRPPANVMREYYRLMGAAGRLEVTERHRATVPEVCEMFLEAKTQVREKTASGYKWHFHRLCKPNMGREFRSLRKEDLVKICESHESWSSGTKYAFIMRCVTLFRWARDAGYLDWNPLAGWDNPYPVPQRTRGLTEYEFTAIMDRAPDLQWKQLMMFMRGTGCRPGEVGVIEARHVHPEQPLVTLEPGLHKTGRRTNKPRVLVLPSDVEVMIRALVKRYPKGPLLRSTRGIGWTTKGIDCRFRRYRAQLGLALDCTPHMIRHSTLTRLLDGGTDVALAAKIAGHASSVTLQGTYYHPDVARMSAAVDKAHARKPKAQGA